VAIYTTFFLCKPSELLAGFPGWKPPLPKPVRRQVKNFFTSETINIETREPDWAEDEEIELTERQYGVVAIEESYADYLEGRIPQVVHTNPHWCSKGLTEIELNPIGQALCIEPVLDYALYSPPSWGATLQQFHPELLSKIRDMNKKELKAVGKQWAAAMSTPEHTHSVSDAKLSDGWEPVYAISILEKLVEVAQQSTDEHGMYLLIEV
jgi:hypothetical protein